MTLPTSLAAYPDCAQLWDAALADSSGARGCAGSYESAINMRSRMHYYRNLLRKQNLTVYPPEHPRHGTSAYDHLYIQLFPDEDGQYWLYVQPRDGKLLAIEGLSDTPPLLEATPTIIDGEAHEIHQIENLSEDLS